MERLKTKKELLLHQPAECLRQLEAGINFLLNESLRLTKSTCDVNCKIDSKSYELKWMWQMKEK